MAALSPMMQQYFEIKKDYPDTILFFRLGDFYEMFFEDAKIASKELELVLTGRDCGQAERAPMCGVPFHSADGYIAKLVSKGYKVAICEQQEDPKAAKGIVKRGVIRVISAGTVIESSMLDESKNNYLGVLYYADSRMGLCFCDVSTGDLHVTSLSDAVDEKTVDELARFAPTEILLNEAAATLPNLKAFLSKKSEATVQMLPQQADSEAAFAEIKAHFGAQKVEPLRAESQTCAVLALAFTLSYLREAQKTDLENLKNIEI